MESDNLDIFKKVIFRIPDLKISLIGIWILGMIYGGLMYFSVRLFTSIPTPYLAVPMFGLFVFILPAIVAGEAFYRFLPDYPRKWSYFLTGCNEFFLFVFSLILSGADNLVNAWHVVWLALVTIYLVSLLTLTLTLGTEYLKRIGVLSAIQSLTVLAAFHIFLGRYMLIPLELYLWNITLLFGAGLLLVVALYTMEYLIGSNIANTSAFNLTSGLLQKKQEALDLGYPSNPEVQTLSIKNEDGELTVAIPWVHPGPLAGFGGGQMTTDIIERLNDEEKGFFLHVPSTHRSDPANPEDTEKLIDAIGEPERDTSASRMIKKEFSHVTFYGRRIDGKNIIYVDAPDYDDFDMAIFQETIDTDKTTVIDLHQEDMAAAEKTMYYNTAIAEKLRGQLKEFIDELEKEELQEYSAGYSILFDHKPFFALVEEVEGQRTLLYGTEDNGLSRNVRSLEEDFREDFDEVLAFSTDTHTSIHDLASEKDIGKDSIRSGVKEAEDRVSKASIGLTTGKAEKMKLLREDYNGLIFSINIIIRLLLMTLVLLYLGLIIWLI